MGAVYDPRFEGVSVQGFIPVLDTGVGADVISSLLANIFTGDVGIGNEAILINASLIIFEGTQTTQEAVGMGAVYDPGKDTGHGTDSVVVEASIPVSDNGIGVEAATVKASVSTNDSGTGLDAIYGVAKAYFYVTPEGVLNPLGVIVLRDSREELLPGTQENTETIPGRHGEIDFGSRFQSRTLELHVAMEGIDRSQREQIKRTIAKYLNPILGPQNLIFADDVEKTYRVKYAGKIDLTQFANWLEFTIPFKAGDPFIIGSFEKMHVGSGIVTNEGTFETPVIIEVKGPVTNPSVTIGGTTLTYTGSLSSADTLIIDTEKMTVTFNGVNALANYSGGFPKLQPGDTVVTAATGGTTIFRWRDRWV